MRKDKIIYLVIFLLLVFSFKAWSNSVSFSIPDVVIRNVSTEINVISEIDLVHLNILINSDTIHVLLTERQGNFSYVFTDKAKVSVDGFEKTKDINPIPLWLSIIPPLIAILLALIFREVITSLFIGVFVGATIIASYISGSVFVGLGKGILSVLDTYILHSLFDKGHLSIITFSLLIGAMVSLITVNGGMKGVVDKISRFANSRKSGQFVTWLLGIAIFFDDYANTLVVGNTMRPITDKLKISRQKLAYIVDSTAAPIAALAFVTTWIGAELSYIESGIEALGLQLSAYTVFLNSLTYSFYPIFTLIFILFLIHKGVDFGPMLKYERKVNSLNQEAFKNSIKIQKQQEGVEVGDSLKGRWYNAVIPVSIVVFGTFVGLIYTGWDENILNNPTQSFTQKLSAILGDSDSYLALLWSSLLATLAAVILSISQRILSLQKSIDSIVEGFKTMLTAVLILILAWSIALIAEQMHTADFITQLMMELKFSPILIPTLTFIVAALVAFSTGSSWGTMAILYPIILPASWLMTEQFSYAYPDSLNIFYNVVASVLAGSVLGDHCSPISDTTILSSLSSSCPHIEHVKTQLPYALVVGAVAIIFGILPASFGLKFYITFPIGLIILYIVVLFFGKKI